MTPRPPTALVHRATLRRLVQATMDHLYEMAACPFCELGQRGEDLAEEDAKHDAECPLAGYELTVDLEALLASTGDEETAT